MNSPSIELQLQQQQQLLLAPRMLQSLQILQMNSMELTEYIQKLAEENPVIEQEHPAASQKELQKLQEKAGWLNLSTSHDTPFLPCGQSDDPLSRLSIGQSGPLETLSEFLNDQLERKRLAAPLLSLCKYMVEMLNDAGYLTKEDAQSIEALGVPSELINQARSILQELEPAGIGAEDLRECLLLQIDRRNDAPAYVRQIVEGHLEAVGKAHFASIARHLQIQESDVTRAAKYLRKLSPRPGAIYETTSAAEYVVPDVYIIETDQGLQVILDDFYLPQVTISNYYTKLLAETKDQEVQQYLHQKLHQANWAVDCLARRKSTLKSCAAAVLELQRNFFSNKDIYLNPMSLKTVAQYMDVHISTVSRCIRGKYLQCRQGLFPLKYFFSHSVSEKAADHSVQAVKLHLMHLIQSENPTKPLSDQQLCDHLAMQGIVLSRRTIAKYREQLRIPSSYARKHM